MDLSISVTPRTGAQDPSVVHVLGEVDVDTAPVLRGGLDSLIAEGQVDLVVDLSGVSFLDSTGLGVLVGRLKQVRRQGGSLSLVCVDERVRKVFAITGLDKVFAIHPSVEAALADPG